MKEMKCGWCGHIQRVHSWQDECRLCGECEFKENKNNNRSNHMTYIDDYQYSSYDEDMYALQDIYHEEHAALFPDSNISPERYIQKNRHDAAYMTRVVDLCDVWKDGELGNWRQRHEFADDVLNMIATQEIAPETAREIVKHARLGNAVWGMRVKGMLAGMDNH